MPVTRTEALDAMMSLTDGAQKVAVGIPQHLLDHPELDQETEEILLAVATVIPLICSVSRQSFIKALDAEDAIDKLKEWIDQHEKKD